MQLSVFACTSGFRNMRDESRGDKQITISINTHKPEYFHLIAWCSCMHRSTITRLPSGASISRSTSFRSGAFGVGAGTAHGCTWRVGGTFAGSPQSANRLRLSGAFASISQSMRFAHSFHRETAMMRSAAQCSYHRSDPAFFSSCSKLYHHIHTPASAESGQSFADFRIGFSYGQLRQILLLPFSVRLCAVSASNAARHL